MSDETIGFAASDDNGKDRLRLVNEAAEEKQTSWPSESAATKLRELIEEVQRKTPRQKRAEDELLPPAA